MKSIIKKLTQSEGLKSSAIVTFGNLGGTTVSAVALMIISRYLGPTQFGVFSAGFSLLLILNRAGDLGINLATQRYLASKKNPENDSMVQSAFLAKAFISVIIILIGLTSSDFISSHFLHLNNPLIVKLAFFSSIAVIYFDYVNTIIQAMQSFSLFAFSVFFQASLKIIGVILMIYFSIISPSSLVILYGGTPFLASLLVGLKNKLHLINFSQSKKTLKNDLKKILPTIKWTSVAVISAALADNLDVLIVQNMLTSDKTGIFSAAVRVATFASLIGLSIGTVLNIRVAKYTTKEHLDTYLRKAKLLAGLSFLAICSLTIFSKLLLLVTAGSSYLGGTNTLSLLLVSTAFLTATTPYISLFFVFEKPQYFAISGILTATILIASDILLIPIFGIQGAGYARIITRGLLFLFTLIYAKKAYKEHIV